MGYLFEKDVLTTVIFHFTKLFTMKTLLKYSFFVLSVTALATGCDSKKADTNAADGETTVTDTSTVVTKDTAQVVTETTVERDTIKK